jgi:kojibiose phosphorylase
MNDVDWTIVETTEAGFSPTQLHHKETVFTLSNGYLGTRGSFEEGYPGASPATLINGVYDDAPVVETELANCPDWLSLMIFIGGDRFRMEKGTVLHYHRWLNLYRGVLYRQVRWRSPAGHTLEFQFERFVSLADEHVMALRCAITSIDFVGEVEVQTSLNAYANNQGMLHWHGLNQGGTGNCIWLQSQSRHSKIELAMASQLQVRGSEPTHQPVHCQSFPTLLTRFFLRPGQPVLLEKVVTVFTSRESNNPLYTALDKLRDSPCYPILLASHEAAWAKVWQISDVVIEGDLTAQLAIRYNLFQLLSAVSRTDTQVSIPAKTLSGFAYRGHVFWDTEIFILPCLILSHPELARNLLTYRYHTLAGARKKARAAGYEGAMYAWESADTGNEVTPSWVPSCNSKDLVRIWCGDLEVHISADVAYAIWYYWRATGDDAWMCAYGAEMILDTAVFWSSRVEWNEAQQRYNLRQVIGPDEYHERVDNNAFTNWMVRWHLQTALDVLDWLCQQKLDTAERLEQQLDLNRDRLQHWQDIIQKIYIPQDPETGLIEQFEGFFNLQDIDLKAYEPRSRSMQAILGIEGANQRQVLKQADVLMLLYLLRSSVTGNPSPGGKLDQDRGTTAQPPVPFINQQTLQTNWAYYEPRTDHTYGSSLGPPVHAILACELGRPDQAYEHFMRAALVDLADIRSNASEGIHAASTGGVWQAVVFGFGGICLTKSGPVATANLPPGWTRLKFNLLWQGQIYSFDLRPERPPVRRSKVGISTMIQGVIFDLDGVLTDTSEFHYQSWQRLADEEGIPFNREINEALRGVSRRDSLLHILKGRPVSEDQLQAMMDRKNRYYLELIQNITPTDLLPGVAELLNDLRSAGIKVALGSASKNARQVVERLGIADQIDAIADGFSVTHSKPAPDIFLHAAAQLGLPPAACIVVEDAASGIEAALRAGMWSVGLGPKERVGAAHVVLPSLEGVRWRDLLDRLTCRLVGLSYNESTPTNWKPVPPSRRQGDLPSTHC